MRISQVSHLYERAAKVWRVELITAQRKRREERLQSAPLLLAQFPWLTSADCLGSPLSLSLSPLLRTQRRGKMLLSAPPRTGINPYNGYTGKNTKRVSTDTPPLCVCPLFLFIYRDAVFVRALPLQLKAARAVLSCSVLEKWIPGDVFKLSHLLLRNILSAVLPPPSSCCCCRNTVTN